MSCVSKVKREKDEILERHGCVNLRFLNQVKERFIEQNIEFYEKWGMKDQISSNREALKKFQGENEKYNSEIYQSELKQTVYLPVYCDRKTKTFTLDHNSNHSMISVVASANNVTLKSANSHQLKPSYYNLATSDLLSINNSDPNAHIPLLLPDKFEVTNLSRNVEAKKTMVEFVKEQATFQNILIGS